MTGATFYNRVRIMLHDKGGAYVKAMPYWTDDEIELKAEAARETVYSTLLDRGSIVTVNRMVSSATAAPGTTVPDDFFRLIIGLDGNHNWVLADGLAIASALGPSGQNVVYVKAGKFNGAAANAYYYRRPTQPMRPTTPNLNEFPDGFYDAVITLTVIELTMADAQDAADRLDELYNLFEDELQSLR